MGYSLCISDLHLSEARPHVTRAFREFLKREAPQTQSLYILGDLFDLWIGDDDDSPLAREIADLLAKFSKSGAKLFLLRGNRDFLLGQLFAERCGASLIEDFSLLNLAGVPTLLSHGDVLCTGDTRYQAFRRQTRDPVWQDAFLSLPLAERRVQAAQMRSQSERSKTTKNPADMDVSEAAVATAMHKHGAGRLIHGHTHRPGRFDVRSHGQAARPGHERIALDEWEGRGNCLRITSNQLEFIYFSI